MKIVPNNKIIKDCSKLSAAELAIIICSAIGIGTITALYADKAQFGLNAGDTVLMAFVLLIAVVTSAGYIIADIKEKKDLNKVLSAAARVYIRDVMDEEKSNTDETKPLLTDHKEVLKDKKAVENLSDYMFNNLRPSEQQDVVAELKKLFKNLKKSSIHSLKTAVKGIVEILKGHAHTQNDSVQSLYIKMLEENNKRYMQQRIDENQQ